MDSYKKNLSSSTPIKPSAIPKLSLPDAVEINENDQSFDQIGSKWHNPKKSMTKNFMSPTISAASKAAMPRKKILVERNGASSSILLDTHVQKTLNLDSRVTSADSGFDSITGYSSQVTPISYRVSESDDDEQNTFVPDSSSQPYDPLKNYLSPRPKFLRYKPNRRLGFFLGRDSELRVGEDGLRVSGCVSFESKKSIEEEKSNDDYGASFSQKGFKKIDRCSVYGDKLSPKTLKNEEIHESEDDDLEDVEVEEEERPCHLIEVLKYLLLLGVLILSTLYISSMNSPNDPTSLEASWDFKERYLDIQNYLSGATVEKFKMGSNFFEQKLEKYKDIRELNVTVDDKGIEKDEIVKHEMEETDEINDTMGEVLELQGIEIADVSNHEMEKTKENFDKVDEILNAQATVTAEISESSPVSHTLFISEWEGDQTTEFGFHSTSESISKAAQDKDEVLLEATERVATYEGIGIEEVVELEMEKLEYITDSMGKLQGREAIEITQASQNQFMLENTDSDIPTTSKTVANSEKDELIRPMKIESISKSTIGVSIFSVIMASLISGLFHLKRRKVSVKDSSRIVQPFPEPVVVENSMSAFASKEDHIEKVDSYINPSSSVHSMDTNSKELYRSKAPTVELLGEYVVGNLSSSHKSCEIKSRMIEGEVSNFSVSQEKRSRSNVPLFANEVHPSLSEFSATGSPSYGSFTVQEKIGRKKDGENGEEMKKVITTPVRRSSRIHNRTVMSP